MRDRLQGLLVVIAVALSGFTLTGPASGPRKSGDAPASPKPVAAPPKADAPKAVDEPKPSAVSPNGYSWKPFDDFWGTGPTSDFSKALSDKTGMMDLEFLIATVPDPIDSRFGYRFDAIVDDVQMAIESQGWNMDHFWLPWQPTGEQPATKDQLGPSKDPADASQTLKLYEREPGVLLFRRLQPRIRDTSPGRPMLLIVFLVGETPTFGIHKTALTKCFDIIDRYKRGIPGQAVDIRIVGPYFSGTARSVTLAISGWADHVMKESGAAAPRFQIRTGGANSIDKKKFVAEGGPAQIGFDATVVHFDNAIKQIMQFLKEKNGGTAPGKVALLTESDTAFGNTKSQDRWTEKLGIDEIVQMKFPFHISQVAVAYDQNKSAKDQNLPTLARSSSKLRIPFDETGSPRDVVPSLSPKMGAATDEFVLSKLLDTISGEDFRYVGIVATDTRDVLFLAGMIREFCPDVQLFTTAGDLLLAHPSYAHALRGTIVASSYPMFSMAQRWDPPYAGDRRRHLFSHETDQGYYNATLSLLFQETREVYRRMFATDLLLLGPFPAAVRQLVGEAYVSMITDYSDDMFDYGGAFDEMDDMTLFASLIPKVEGPSPHSHGPLWFLEPCPESWRPPAWHREQPPLWLGVVGQRGLWPLETREFTDHSDYLYASYYRSPCMSPRKFLEQFIPIIPQYHWIWGTMFLGLSALIWAIFLAHGRVVRAYLDGTDGGDLGPPPSSEHRWLLVELMRRRGPPLRRQQETYFLSAVAILAIAYGYCVILPCGITLFKSPWHVFLYRQIWGLAANWLFSLCVLMIATATAVALVARVRLYWNPAFDRVLPAWVFPALAAAAVVVVALYRQTWGLATWGDRANWLFSLLVLVIATATTVALVATLVARLRLYWTSALPAWAFPALVAVVVVALYRQTWGLTSWGDRANWLFSLPVLMIATATSVALVRLYWSPAFDRVLPAWAFPALAAVVVVAVAGVITYWPIAPSPPYHDLLFFERAVNLGNGVSPLTPVLIMTLVCALWLACQQRRLALVERLWVNGPFDGDTRPPLDRLARSESKIHDLLTIWFPRIFAHPACLIGLGLVVIAILRLVQRFIPTVDGHLYSFLMILAFCFLSCIVLFAFFRFVFLWRSLRTLLRDLTLLPMVKSYDRLPAVIALSFGRYLDDLHPKLSNLTLAVRQWAVVARDFEAAQIEMAEAYFGRPLGQLDYDQGTRLDRLARAIELDPDLSGAEAAEQIRKHFENECALGDHVTFSRSDTRSGIRNAAAACLAILPSLWDRGSLEEGYGEPPKDAAAAGGTPANETPLLRWRREAEDLVALEFILFVGQCSVHLRNLATFLALGPILMAIAIASYPFQPERFLMVFAWSIAFCVAMGVIWVFVEMEHNEFLSRVSKTEPGKMTFDRTFVTSTLTYIIPLLGILIAQFPQVSDVLNQWFEPVLRVLK